MEASGMLVAVSHAPRELEPEYNEWYDKEHVPERMAIEGFYVARRFVCPRDMEPKYLAIYELANVEVLDSAAYTRLRSDGRTEWALSILSKVKMQRYECYSFRAEEVSALPLTPHLLVTVAQVPDVHRSDFVDWVDRVYIPHICRVSGVRLARRFFDRLGKENVLILHDVDSLGVPDSQEFRAVLEDADGVNFVSYCTKLLNKTYKQLGTNRTVR